MATTIRIIGNFVGAICDPATWARVISTIDQFI